MDLKNSFWVAMIYKLGKNVCHSVFIVFNYANQIREHFFKTREKTRTLKRLEGTEFQIINSKDLLSDELYH